MNSMIKFLLDRIEEDRAQAQSVIDTAEEQDGFSTAAWMVASMPQPAAGYVIRWGPTTILEECRVKEETINSYLHASQKLLEDELYTGVYVALGEVILSFAQLYRNHPEFDPNWRDE